jgi:hypothetical protein
MLDLQGKSYKFDDGNSITVVQVKKTDEDRGGYLVTYHIKTGPGIPQKLILPLNEFIGHYGHLFGLADEQ